VSPTLVTRLRAHGFVAEEQETVLVGLAEEMTSHRVPLPEGVILRRTTDERDMHRIAAMESAVWGHDMQWLAEDLIAGAGACTVFVAEVREVIVAAAWLVERPGTEFAALWGGSTLARWRRQGIYRALIAQRTRLALERGIRYLQVDASDAITSTTPHVWTPS
jgi:GNAT superfamily N-acetyltransferase